MPKVPSDKRYAWIASAVVGAAVVVLAGVLAPGFTLRVETFVYDRAMRMGNATPSNDVALITIDQASTSHLGAWPWPHTVHAQLIERLHEAGANVVAFTMPFGDAQNRNGIEQLRTAINLLQVDDLNKAAQVEQLKKLLDSSVADLDQDSALASAMEKHGNVLLPIEARISTNADARVGNANIEAAPGNVFLTADPELSSNAYSASDIHMPPSSLTSHARALGHTVLENDSEKQDAVVHADLGAIRAGEKYIPSLAIAIAARMRGMDISQIKLDDEALLTIGNQQLQLDGQLKWKPAFYPTSGERSPKTFSYWQVLSGEIGSAQLRGKTVLIGITDASGTHGFIAPTIATPLGVQMAPVQVIGGMLSSLHTDRHYRHPGWAFVIEWLLTLGLLASGALLLPRLGTTLATLASVLIITALLLLEIGLLNLNGIWLQLMLPVFAVLATALSLNAAMLFKRLRTPRGQATDAVESLRMLGLTFQGQGQLDLAYETFRRCPGDGPTLDLLYGLGQDYERRRQFNKAAEVYGYLASLNTGYKDVVQRRDRMKRADVAQATPRSASRPVARSNRDDPPTIPVPFSDQITITRKQTLGRYEIERELGKGAMGVVYLGRDPKINRVVAIKAIALAEEFAEEDLVDARERFFREAEMAGRLNHPGIVTVYDAGEDRGLAYIAMEYLRGEHLSHYAEPTYLLPPTRVLSLAARVADALDYAHKQNVVHRDIKPANIMFNKDSDDLKITDFGIARLTDTSRTKTGIVLGTPSFMSPEQLEGRPLDGRSDLFALGIALYQLLTGQLPFRADSMTRLMQKIATEQHVPLRSLRPEMPDMAEQIITRALAKSATERYQTGSEMAVALRNCTRAMTRKEAVVR